jgi:hypothetical protein
MDPYTKLNLRTGSGTQIRVGSDLEDTGQRSGDAEMLKEWWTD